MNPNTPDNPPDRDDAPERMSALEAPFLHAPEAARTIFAVTLAAACGPLLAGAVLFGWRAVWVAGLSVAACAAIERFYYRVTRTPALLGRTHAFLTGVLLALTLPPFVPWYVPVVASAMAILVGKAIFGGVGHFLWQPALVGRLAVAVMFPAALTVPAPRHAGHWPVLAQDRLLLGDIRLAAPVPQAVQWKGQPAPTGAHALLMVPPATVLAGLTGPRPTFSALAYPRTDLPGAAPAALLSIPPIEELLYGARPGGIGETCALVILVAGLYLMYRNYVRWHLPVSFLLAAAAVAAIAPVRLAGAGEEVRTVWLPLTFEGFDVGFTYVNYQLLSGGILLAAFFLATEMTTRPVTPNGQVVFGLGCGALAMALQLNLPARGLGLNIQTPIPAYVAVLAMNTLTPWIENIWRPRVLGQKRFLWVFRKDA